MGGMGLMRMMGLMSPILPMNPIIPLNHPPADKHNRPIPSIP